MHHPRDWACHWRHFGPDPGNLENDDTIEDSRGKWDVIAENLTDITAQSPHPVFPVAENLKNGTLKSKGGKPPSTSSLVQKKYTCS